MGGVALAPGDEHGFGRGVVAGFCAVDAAGPGSAAADRRVFAGFFWFERCAGAGVLPLGGGACGAGFAVGEGVNGVRPQFRFYFAFAPPDEGS